MIQLPTLQRTQVPRFHAPQSVPRCLSTLETFRPCLDCDPASMLHIQESAYADLKNTTTYSLVPPRTNEKTMTRATSCVGVTGTEPLCCLHGKIAFGARYPNDLMASARVEAVMPRPIQWLSLAGIS